MGFLPSRDAFAFDNGWPSEPAVVVNSVLGRFDVGDASNGLCGGMVFAVRDYLEAGRTSPSVRPEAGTPLFRYLVSRLITSWDLPRGVAKYYQWMGLPDGDVSFALFGHRVVATRGVTWRTVVEELPAIRAELDAGELVCLGLVTVHSANPSDLGQCHQVLAYGYETVGTAVSLRVYDPNRGPDDGVRITVDAPDPTRPAAISHNLGLSHPVRGLFRVPYLPATPPI